MQTSLIGRLIKRSVILLLVPILTATIVSAQGVSSEAAKGEKEKVIRQVVDNWIKIGNEEFNRGFYAASEKALMRAKDYEQYLTTAERDQLNGLLQKVHNAALERENALTEMRAAGELTEKQKFAEAKEHLETVQSSEFLTDAERQKVKEQLDTIDKNTGTQKSPAMADTARAPADTKPAQSKAEMSARANLDAESVRPVMSAEVREIAQPAVVTGVQTERQPLATASAEPEQQQTSYIAAVTRRRNVIRSRVDAVVNDAVNRAEADMSKGQFDKAQEAVDTADRTVSENSQQLGDDLVKQHKDRLAQLSDRIAAGKKQQGQQIEENKRLKAEESQRSYKEQMSSDRQRRVADLMTKSLAFQKQQRYKEAIGQLDMLLAIEPQNYQALVLKQTLEDMVNFRQQIDIKKEKDRERVDLMKSTAETKIPYADEMTHPKNWREIVNKRGDTEDVIGQEPADAQVYKALEEIVDLSKLSPEMPLGEAIKMLKNSVDPSLEIYVNWNDLRTNANIDQTTPINMDPMTKVRLGLALDLLLRSVSAGIAELTYIVKDGVVNVATRQTLPPQMITWVYDVSVLVGRPANYYVSTSGQGGGGGGAGGGGGGAGGGGGGAGGGTYSEEFEESGGGQQGGEGQNIEAEAAQRMDNLRLLIQDTIAPDSWYDYGGEATITAYENKKLVVYQTAESHRLIAKLLRDMRDALGHQVAIEARFLVVGENFLEEIGLDVYAQIDLGNRFGTSVWQLQSFEMAAPTSTGITGSFGFTDQTAGIQFPPGAITSGGSPQFVAPGAMLGFFGGRLGGILDNLQADFLIRATQAHRDTESLVAPKVTVLSGESATLQVRQTIRFPLLPSVSTVSSGSGSSGFSSSGSSFQQNYGSIPTGPTLNITPTITPDKKHVLLNIVVELQDFLGFNTTLVETPVIGTAGAGGGTTISVVPYSVTLPQTERSRVQTRVNVPDSGTLLLGGLKRSASNSVEVGVPILSKIPVLGRLFTNRSRVADQKILLILVKPTIILTEEADSEAIAAMEGQTR